MNKIKLTILLKLKSTNLHNTPSYFYFEDTEGDLKEISRTIQDEIQSNLEGCKSSIYDISILESIRKRNLNKLSEVKK
jgi:hypothetical protein